MSGPIPIRGYGARNLHLTLGAIGTDRSDASSWTTALCGERVWKAVRCDNARRSRCLHCLRAADALVSAPDTLTLPVAEVAELRAIRDADRNRRDIFARAVGLTFDGEPPEWGDVFRGLVDGIAALQSRHEAEVRVLRKALAEIEAYTVQHHEVPAHAVYHALTVDIPAVIDRARAAVATPSATAMKERPMWPKTWTADALAAAHNRRSSFAEEYQNQMPAAPNLELVARGDKALCAPPGLPESERWRCFCRLDKERRGVRTCWECDATWRETEPTPSATGTGG